MPRHGRIRKNELKACWRWLEGHRVLKTGFYPAKTIEKHGNINDFGLRPARPAQAAI